MKAVLLANMGAPESEKDMKVFLKLMFSDKAIIYAPKMVRILVSTMISNIRYKSSWKKYKSIGGSPLLKSMENNRRAIESKLTDDYVVRSVYSFSPPFIKEEIIRLYKQGVKDFFIISMYPQASYSTSGSVQSEIDQLKLEYTDAHFSFKEDYFDNQYFIDFWVNQIKSKITSMGYKSPFLLFSSHAIPQSFVKRGDQYVEKIKCIGKTHCQSIKLDLWC